MKKRLYASIVFFGALALASCDSSTAPVVNRTFCVKVYAQGTTPPTACNSRAVSESFAPMATITAAKGAAATTVVVETVVQSGPNNGVANFSVVAQPSINGVPTDLTVTRSGPTIPMPGSATVAIRSATSTKTGTYTLKWFVEDNETKAQQEVVVSVIVP